MTKCAVIVVSLILFLCGATSATTNSPALNSRHVPARQIPVPDDVSPELQRAIAKPLPATIHAPKSIKAWRRLIEYADKDSAPKLAKLREAFPLAVVNGTMAGVKVYTVLPEKIAPKNRNRILVHLHGGAYVFYGGDSAVAEAILMAHYGQIKVISVDYRMPPDHPFPAALDDAVAVWKEILKQYPARNVGLFGTSSGGGLTLATVHKLKSLRLPLPGAIAPGSPWADLSTTGDSYFTNKYVDDMLLADDNVLAAAAKLYANGNDLKDPFISPIFGDFQKFPPAILTSGTRDLLLSNTVRVHQKMIQANVDARLQVIEGLSHAEYVALYHSPESQEVFREIAKFFDSHLSRK